MGEFKSALKIIAVFFIAVFVAGLSLNNAFAVEIDELVKEIEKIDDPLLKEAVKEELAKEIKEGNIKIEQDKTESAAERGRDKNLEEASDEELRLTKEGLALKGQANEVEKKMKTKDYDRPDFKEYLVKEGVGPERMERNRERGFRETEWDKEAVRKEIEAMGMDRERGNIDIEKYSADREAFERAGFERGREEMQREGFDQERRQMELEGRARENQNDPNIGADPKI